MAAISEIIGGYKEVTSPAQCVSGDGVTCALFNPGNFDLEVAPRESLRLVILHDRAADSVLKFRLSEEARLEVTEIFVSGSRSQVEVEQLSSSSCDFKTIQLSSSEASYRFDLNGRGAESTLEGVFLTSEKEHSVMNLLTRHNVPDCRSLSNVKGIAGGESVGEFHGLVYVAFDAQRTDARQQSRNILLSPAAKIITKPQLEIYADDVKCTHGATVGQMDAEAVYYMRQRGLSEQLARSLQIEGFVGDVIRRHSDGNLGEALMEMVASKMEKM